MRRQPATDYRRFFTFFTATSSKWALPGPWKTSWGSLPAATGKASVWIPGADGSAIIGSDTSCVAIDFSRASGADGMLVMTGSGAPGEGTVSAGGRKFSFKFLTAGAAPRPKVEGDKIVIGTQTVSFKDGRIVLGKMARP